VVRSVGQVWLDGQRRVSASWRPRRRIGPGNELVAYGDLNEIVIGRQLF
jgi:hypothetical protein